MKTLNGKTINGEFYLEMAAFNTEEEARQKSGSYRSKYGNTRVVKRKDGKYCIYCKN